MAGRRADPVMAMLEDISKAIQTVKLTQAVIIRSQEEAKQTQAVHGGFLNSLLRQYNIDHQPLQLPLEIATLLPLKDFLALDTLEAQLQDAENAKAVVSSGINMQFIFA